MGLIKCRNCGKELSDGNEYCSLCGTRLKNTDDEKNIIKEEKIVSKEDSLDVKNSFFNDESKKTETIIKKPKNKIKKVLKILGIIILTIAFGIGIGFIVFKVTGGKLVSNTFSNQYFSVKYKQDMIVSEEGNTVNFYISKGNTPYISITKYDEYKTSDTFFTSFIPLMQAQYGGRGFNVGTRTPISIGNKMVENITMAYMMNGVSLNDNRYVYSTGTRTWVFAMKEDKTRGDNLYPLLTQFVKSFKEK